MSSTPLLKGGIDSSVASRMNARQSSTRYVRRCASAATYRSCSTSTFQPRGTLRKTVSLLARMARFIIADLTDPSSIPKELEAIVPHLAVPVQPLLEGSSRPYAMFKDYWKYDTACFRSTGTKG